MAVDIASLTIAIDTLQAIKAGQDLDKLTASSEKLSGATKYLSDKFIVLGEVIAAAVTVAAFTEMVKRTVELEAGFVRLAQVAGTTASNISGMALPAALAGSSLDAMASAMGKLNREIGLAKLGDFGNKSQMLRAIGIDPGAGEDPAEVLLKVARALTSMKDPMIASKVAFDLLGRSYAELKPALIELVNQGGIHARVTDEEAAAAKELSDTWIRLKASFEDSAIALTNKLVPALTAVLQHILRIKQSKISDLDLSYLAEGVPLDFNPKQPTGSQSQVRASDNAIFAAGQSQQKSAEQVAVENLLTNQKLFAQRMETVKAQGVAYADAIKTASELANLSEKEGGVHNLRTQEDLLHDQQRLDDLALQQQINAQKEIRRLELGKDSADLQGKARAANEAIALLGQQRAQSELLVEARIRAARTATYQLQIDQYNAINTQHAQAGEVALQGARTLQEKEKTIRDQQLTDLEVYFAEKKEKTESDVRAEGRLQLESQSRLGDIRAQGRLDAMKFDEMTFAQQVDNLANFGASATSTAASHNKKMFELNKIFGEAQIIISTTIGVMKAWEMGPIIGPIMAALVGAAGAINLQTLRATQYGGGGSIAPSIGAAAGGALPVVNVPPTPAASIVGAGGAVTVVIQGNLIGNQDFIDNTLIPALQDAVNHRDVVIVGADSRQSQVIHT